MVEFPRARYKPSYRAATSTELFFGEKRKKGKYLLHLAHLRPQTPSWDLHFMSLGTFKPLNMYIPYSLGHRRNYARTPNRFWGIVTPSSTWLHHAITCHNWFIILFYHL